MKKCKYCQSEIEESAKICPNCRKKQGPHIVKWIILGICALLVVSCFFGGSDEKEEFQKEYKQSDVVVYNDIKYSITKVERTKSLSDYESAEDGYEYIKVSIKIENNSDEKIPYNVIDFKMVNGDGVEDGFAITLTQSDILLHSGDLDPNGKIEGVIIFKQKENDKNLKLRYYDNLFDDGYTFQIELDK